MLSHDDPVSKGNISLGMLLKLIDLLCDSELKPLLLPSSVLFSVSLLI